MPGENMQISRTSGIPVFIIAVLVLGLLFPLSGYTQDTDQPGYVELANIGQLPAWLEQI